MASAALYVAVSEIPPGAYMTPGYIVRYLWVIMRATGNTTPIPSKNNLSSYGI